MRTLPLLLSGLLAATLSAPALAEKHHAHDHAQDRASSHGHGHDHGEESLGVHQHGVAQLNVVVDGSSVEIELDSPAENLVGFEYIPTREQDLAKVRSVREQLQRPAELFALPEAAQCTAQPAELKSPLFAALDSPAAEHDHGEDHQHKDEHQHAKHEHKHNQAAHSDIEAHYRFECANPDALSQIEVLLFERFPGTQRLVLQAIGGAGQRGGELTPTQNIVRF